MKKSILLAGVFLGLLGLTTVGVVAQSAGAQAEKGKPKATTGKPHTMTGCLEQGTEPNTFRLTNVEGTGPKTVELHAAASQKLSAHLGHKISITGPDVDPATMKKGTTGKPGEPAAAPKPAAGEHHMRVTSFKMISATCPQ